MSATQIGIAVEDSNGTVGMNTVKFPQLLGGSNTLTGFSVFGPRGGVTVSNNTVSGGIGYYVYLASVDSITSGPTVLSQNNFSNQATLGRGYGLYTHSSVYSNANAVVVTDNVFAVGGQQNGATPTSYGFDIDSTNVLIERNRFTVGPSYGVSNTITNSSTVELYDNYAAFGVNSYYADALELYGTSTVYAIGNTLDPGGAPTQGTSRGIYCNAMGASTTFVSNLIGGGRSSTHLMVYNSSTNCINPAQAASKNNYFWYSGSGPQQATEAVYSLTGGSGSAPLNGNLVDTAPSNGCYDSTTTQPDLHIGTSSVCVDKGLTGNRRDGTAITLDVLSMTRTLGTAPDIGCFEAK